MIAVETLPPDVTAAPVVVVVESDVIVRMAVTGYLTECGYKVIGVRSSDEAMRVLQSEHAVDVVLSELNLPGSVDGFGLAQWIRRTHGSVKVILTSGLERKAKAAGELCEHGPILTKPYEHAELERRIREMLPRR